MPCGVQTSTSTLTLGASARKRGVSANANGERMPHSKRNVPTLSSLRNLIFPPGLSVCLLLEGIAGGSLEQARIRLPNYDVLKCLSGLPPWAYSFDIGSSGPRLQRQPVWPMAVSQVFSRAALR